MDEAKNGFIIFTLGSQIKLSSMPDETLQSFIRVFAKLKTMRIVWKWEGHVPDNLPPNVLTSAWLPQQDLLGILTFHIIFLKYLKFKSNQYRPSKCKIIHFSRRIGQHTRSNLSWCSCFGLTFRW